jgi:hypothetical protein
MEADCDNLWPLSAMVWMSSLQISMC